MFKTKSVFQSDVYKSASEIIIVTRGSERMEQKFVPPLSYRGQKNHFTSNLDLKMLK